MALENGPDAVHPLAYSAAQTSTDQLCVQRFMTTKSLSDCRRSFLTMCLMNAVMVTLLGGRLGGDLWTERSLCIVVLMQTMVVLHPRSLSFCKASTALPFDSPTHMKSRP